MTKTTLVRTGELDDLINRLVGRSSHFLHFTTPHSRFLQGKGKNEGRKTKKCLIGCSTYLTLYSPHSTTDNYTEEKNKMKNITSSKSIGKLTGKLVAGTKALPKKSAEVSKSLKDEFMDGFRETSGSNKGMGDESVSDESPAHK